MENPAILLRRLNPYCARAMEGAATLCQTRAHAEILPEHWLLKLLEQGEGDLTVLARRYEWDMDAIWQDLLTFMDKLPRSVRGRPQLSDAIQTLMQEAWLSASLAGEEHIRSIHLLMALVDKQSLVRCDGLWPLLTLAQSQLARLRPLLDAQSEERPEVQQNFPIRSSETAYLFLQHFIRKLKAGGRAAIVIKNTFLSNTDNASVELRRELLASCNLHTVLDCPSGTFQGAGVKTVVLFFDKGAPTRKIWYYQLDPGRSLGKTNPLNDADLAEFVALQKTKAGGEKSWTVDVADVDTATCDLSVKNPHSPEAMPQRSPQQIIDDMLARDAETAKLLAQVRGML